MEKWKKVYTKEQIRHIQKIELRNLAILQNVCSKLNIKFFAYGGTLIGAVRHKGFIPWDDDLDVAMLRKDYEKFIKQAYNYLPPEYELQTPYTDKKTPYPYAKLRLRGTKYVEYGYHKLKIEHGIYVDIYPIDNLSDDDNMYYKQFKQYQLLSKIYAWRQCPYLTCDGNNLRAIIKYCISSLLKVLPQQYLIKKIDKIATRYNNKKTMRKGNLNFPRPVNIFYNLYPFEEGEFDGYYILLPGNWRKHLESRYGNYMEMPPEEERLGHKPYLLDFGEY